MNVRQDTWKDIYSAPFNTTSNSKLQWLQYRINHRNLVTNTFLFKIGKTDNNLCSFCKHHPETIIHILWDCQLVSNLIENLRINIIAKDLGLRFDKKEFILGKTVNKHNKFDIDNLILLTIKHYIYKSRCLEQQLNYNSLKSHIKTELKAHRILLSKCNLKNKGQLSAQIQKWLDF